MPEYSIKHEGNRIHVIDEKKNYITTGDVTVAEGITRIDLTSPVMRGHDIVKVDDLIFREVMEKLKGRLHINRFSRHLDRLLSAADRHGFTGSGDTRWKEL